MNQEIVSCRRGKGLHPNLAVLGLNLNADSIATSLSNVVE